MKKYVLMEVEKSKRIGNRYTPIDVDDECTEFMWIEPSRIIDEEELKHRINMVTGGDYREEDIEILIHSAPKSEKDEWERWIDDCPIEAIRRWYLRKPRKEKREEEI